MKPLYLHPAVHSVLPDALRPGGLALTRELAERITIKEKIIVDAGCGNGASLDFLLQHQPKQLIGLDIERELLKNAAQRHPAIEGNIADIPLKTGSIDLVIAECAWNMSCQQSSLAEFHRILCRQGKLALTDIYRKAPAQNEKQQWPIPCCFAAAKTRGELEQMLKKSGFIIEYFADHSKLLKESAARFIFQFGSLQQFWQAVCGEQKREEAKQACSLTKAMLPGLFFLIAGKNR